MKDNNQGMVKALLNKKPIDIKGKPSKYFVYKIKCRLTKHYYIGMTSILMRRLYNHNLCIIKVIKGTECTSLPYHRFIAITLMKQAILSGNVADFVHDSFDIYTLAIVETNTIARIVEKEYLKDAIKDDFCLNWNT